MDFKLKDLRMDWRAVVAVVVTTLLLCLDAYRTLFNNELLTRTLFYLVIPLLTILLVFRQSPADYGFRLGDWRAGLALTGAACVAMALVMTVIARTDAFSNYYQRLTLWGLPFWLADGIELLGWEFFFRGFLLFALYRTCGPLALVLQAVPFAMAHIGKPEFETLSCIFGGTAFGYVAWRTRSFLYPFLIHWFMAVFTTLVASGALG
ncbi:MAG: CPBP family intramembrane metalloprotease [Anaerolineae bacterium]|nr:CPBP family intramembrane metalloprotease [Anaerolineae bacterium]